MLIYLYVFALVLGGVLLGASMLFGGKDAGHDHTHDSDSHADAEGGSGGGIEAFLVMFLSARFWTFFLTFFGITGLVLTGFGLVSSWIFVLLLAAGMGAFSGTLAAQAIRRLSREESNSAVSEKDYVGKSARVMVPIVKGAVGKVRVQVKGTAVDLLATTDDAERLAAGDEVLVIGVDGMQLRVSSTQPGGTTNG